MFLNAENIDDMTKGTWKYSVLKSKCPRCNQGELWEKENSYTKGFDKMHIKCENCALIYEMEPGFWYGAMYISYAMGVFVTVGVVIVLSLFTNLSIVLKLVTAFVFLIALVPILYRYSRNLWINVFIHFDSKYFKLKESAKVHDVNRFVG